MLGHCQECMAVMAYNEAGSQCSDCISCCVFPFSSEWYSLAYLFALILQSFLFSYGQLHCWVPHAYQTQMAWWYTWSRNKRPRQWRI